MWLSSPDSFALGRHIQSLLRFNIIHYLLSRISEGVHRRFFPSMKLTSHRRHRHHEALSSEGVYKHMNSSIATDLSYLSFWLHTPLYHLLAALYYWRTARGSDRDQSTGGNQRRHLHATICESIRYAFCTFEASSIRTNSTFYQRLQSNS
jgi:hypothetical protein